MIIQVQITEEKLAEYITMLGYETAMFDVLEWRNEYHNRCEPYYVRRLHVVFSDGSKKPAKDFFEQIIDETIINLLKNKNGNNRH
jgi:hypothetical protein